MWIEEVEEKQRIRVDRIGLNCHSKRFWRNLLYAMGVA